MRFYCPQCFRKYEGGEYDTCPEDGARLYALTDKRDDPLLGTVVDDRFRIEEILGEGGMGSVYKATQLSVHREVALKILRPDLDEEELFLERFFREARVVAELSHPNIVRLIDFGQDRESKLLFLVMELVKGTDMAGLLEQGRLKTAMALDVVYQVCAGLTEPHSRGIVHRDLKPDNIILLPISDGTFQVKLLDFGIARTETAGTRLTQTGMICGTPAYMSPEQAQNIEVTPQTDLYSLGVVLFEMLTGHLPFEAVSGLQLLIDHVQRPPPKLSLSYPGVFPEEISSLVSDLLEKKPEDRPKSAREVRRRIQKIRKTLDLAPVVLSEDESAQPGAGDDQDALFAPWLLPSMDPDKPGGLAAPQPTATEAPRDSLAFGDTAAAVGPGSDHSSKPMALAGTVADESTGTKPGHAPATPPQGADNAGRPTSAEDSGFNALVIGGAVAAVVVLAAMAFVILSLLSDDGDIESALQADLDDTSPVVVDESDDDGGETDPSGVDADKGIAASDDDRDPDGDRSSETDEADQYEGAPNVEGPAVAALDSPSVDHVVAPDTPTPEVPTPQPPPTVDDTSGHDAPSPQDGAVADGSGGTVYEGMLMITTAAQADAARSYREVTGGLFIQLGSASISKLELPDLKTIGGPLTITRQSGIDSLSLPSLERLGGALSIIQVDDGFELHIPNLDTVEEGLSITNTNLSSLVLDGIRRVRGMVVLTNNDQMESLTLTQLESVGGMFTVSNSPNLSTINAPRLRTIDDQLIFTGLGLTMLSFDRLQTLGGALVLNDLESLQRVSFANLTSVGMSSTSRNGQLVLSEFPNLVDLQLPRLQKVKDNMIIVNTPRITRLDLGGLKEVGGQLNLTNNQGLQRINLEALSKVGGDLIINNNPALENLTLENLKAADEVRILNNGRLSNCTVQSIVEDLQALGWLGESWTVNNLDDGC